jgi:peptide/nickel transport system substrate-binding protein
MNRPEPSPDQHLRLVGPADLDSLDPAVSHLPPAGQLARLHARQLFTYPPEPDLRDFRAVAPVPDIAADIPSIYNAGVGASHRSYTVHLRRGVWWDTTPAREVTAHDFVRAFKRMGNPVAPCPAISYFTSTVRGMTEYCRAYAAAVGGTPTAEVLAAFQHAHDIPGVRAVDDHTLVFELTRPAPDFLWILALPCVSPTPVEYDAFLPDSPELGANLRATGPYRLLRYRPGTAIRLAPNPAWCPESDPVRHQRLAGIEVRIRPATSAEVAEEIASGRADLPWGADAARVDDEPPARGGGELGYSLDPYLVFNVHGAHADRSTGRVTTRRAIGYAIDRAAIAGIVAELAPDVQVRIAHAVVPPGNDAYQGADPYPASGERGDPDRSRALLDSTGDDNLHLTLIHLDSALATRVAASCAADLEKVGVAVRTVPLGHRDYQRLLLDPARAGRGEWDIALAARAPDWYHQNARVFLQPMFQSSPYPSPLNYGGYRNPAVDRLIETALSSFQRGEAEQAWREVERRVLADAAVVPILFRAPAAPQRHAARVRDAITIPTLAFTVDLAAVCVDGTDGSEERDG